MSKHVVKSKTYIVHQNGGHRQPAVIGRYRIGAKNPDEAADLLRKLIGKHAKVRVYYEVNPKVQPDLLLPRGEVIHEC